MNCPAALSKIRGTASDWPVSPDKKYHILRPAAGNHVRCCGQAPIWFATSCLFLSRQNALEVLRELEVIPMVGEELDSVPGKGIRAERGEIADHLVWVIGTRVIDCSNSGERQMPRGLLPSLHVCPLEMQGWPGSSRARRSLLLVGLPRPGSGALTGSLRSSLLGPFLDLESRCGGCRCFACSSISKRRAGLIGEGRCGSGHTGVRTCKVTGRRDGPRQGEVGGGGCARSPAPGAEPSVMYRQQERERERAPR